MGRFTRRIGTFIRNFNECVSSAAKDSEDHYYLPKSRFRDNGDTRESCNTGGKPVKFVAKNAFLGSFRDCFIQAWRNSDEYYHIPKRRLADDEYNRTAYRSKSEPSTLDMVVGFPRVLKGCISMAWKASDTLYYLPKSRYQDREFVTNLMGAVPRPPGKLLIRPFTIGFGVVGSEGTVQGWTVGLPTARFDREFFSPEDIDPDTKPELEL